MDAVHIHLIINHIPIIGTLFGICLFTYGLLRKNNSLTNAGLVTFILTFIITIPTYLSGGEAEEKVEHIAGVSEHFLEEHEELAEIGLYAMIVLGAVSLLTLVFAKRKSAIYLRIITLLIALGSLIVMAIVANHGAKIRHSEIHNTQNTDLTPTYDDDDDDDD